jgi:hypothetical protein
VDVSVERASIALLLGDSNRALELLGITAGPGGAGGAAKAHEEVLAFIQVRGWGQLTWLGVQ